MRSVAQSCLLFVWLAWLGCEAQPAKPNAAAPTTSVVSSAAQVGRGEVGGADEAASAETASGAGSAAPPKPEELPRGAVSVTRSEAKAAGLVDVEVSLTVPEGGIFGHKLSGGDVFFNMSGPPGGPLGFAVVGYRDTKPSQVDEAYAAHLARRGDPPDPFVKGAATKLSVAGAERHARPYLEGESLAKSHNCVVLVPSPRNENEGVMVILQTGASAATTEPSCDGPVGHSLLGAIVASLTVR